MFAVFTLSFRRPRVLLAQPNLDTAALLPMLQAAETGGRGGAEAQSGCCAYATPPTAPLTPPVLTNGGDSDKSDVATQHCGTCSQQGEGAARSGRAEEDHAGEAAAPTCAPL